MFANGLTVLTALLPLLTAVNAAHVGTPNHRRHHALANRDQPAPRGVAQVAPRANAGHAEAQRTIKRVVKKRAAKQQCRVRGSSPPAPASSVAPSPAASSIAPASSAAAPVSSAAAPASSAAAPSPSAAESPEIPNQGAWADHSTPSSAAPAPAPPASSQAPPQSSAASGGGLGGAIGGIISLNDATCGWCGASDDAPNGSEEWLNCGLQGGGWSPPHLGLDNLVYQDLHGDGVFSACAPYFWAFEQYGSQYGIPPILLASFAMQESTCNPGATGGNGEAGLMQLASVNCGGAPGGNCYDINFNVDRAARLFRTLVDNNNGNVLIAAGGYNGWRVGMTADDAQAARWQGNCHAQNNLDYLHQLFNGWCQGRNGYSMGTWFNLAAC